MLIEKEIGQILFEENADALFSTDLLENLLFIDVYLKEHQEKEVDEELMEAFRNIILEKDEKEKAGLLETLQTTQNAFYEKMKADFESLAAWRGIARNQNADLRKASVRELAALAGAVQEKLGGILPAGKELGAALPKDEAPGLSGIKVRSLQKDGCLLLESSSRTMNGKNKRLLAVILNEPDESKMRLQAAHLLLIGYRDHETLKILSKDAAFYELDILKGCKPKITVKPGRDVYAAVKKDQLSNINSIIGVNLEFPHPLTAPIDKDEKIGDIIITVSGKKIAGADLLAAESIKKSSFLNRLIDNFNSIK